MERITARPGFRAVAVLIAIGAAAAGAGYGERRELTHPALVLATDVAVAPSREVEVQHEDEVQETLSVGEVCGFMRAFKKKGDRMRRERMERAGKAAAAACRFGEVCRIPSAR
jgi:hypothetical protein